LAIPTLMAALALVYVVHHDESGATYPIPGVQPTPPARLLPTRPPVFPLKIDPTGRYLVDSDGRPFLIVGDSPQALITNLSEARAGRFFADREAAGFNSVWINLLCDTYTGGRADGDTYDGIAPFAKPEDLSTPNPAYFKRAFAMIRLAAQHHLAVFLDPIETGGWLKVLRHNGSAKAYAYGQYVGRSFRRFANIIWLSGNDFQSWRDRRDDELALAVARGIRSVDPGALQTVELNYNNSTSLDDPRWRGLLGLDAVYTYGPTYAEVLKAYSANQHLPVFLLEASYEGEFDYSGPQTLRRELYWSLLSGAAGQFYGNKYTWQFLPSWRGRLDTVGSRQETFAVNLLSRRSWYELVPDADHRLVVSGYGQYRERGDLNTIDYVAAGRTPDGRLAIAYLPDGGAIKVNLALMTGPEVRAQWYDPTSGRYSPVKGSPFPSSGTRSITAPRKNGEGDDDWVLVLTQVKGGQ
jgi:hypothetical protein